MKSIVLNIVCTITALAGLTGQAGIYSESDIELQNLFIEAQLEKQKGNFEEQVELLREVVRRDRRAHAAYYEMARAYLEMENAELAESNLNKAIRIEPDNEWYLELLVSTLQERKKYLAAAQEAETLTRLSPKKLDYRFLKAENQNLAGDTDAAIQTLLDAENAFGVREEISKRIFRIYDNTNQIDKAILTLQKLADNYPGNVRLLSNLAGFLYENNRKEDALEHYRHIQKLDPDNPEANLVLAREENESDPSSGKLVTIEKMITNDNIGLDDIIIELMPLMSNMNREGEQTERLKKISRQLLDKYPNEAKTHAVRADILFYAGQLKEAENHYESAIGLNNSKYILWDQWIVSLYELGKHKKMKLKAEEAIDLFPNQFFAWLYYSVALETLGKPHEALDYLQEARLIAGRNKAFIEACDIVKSWMDLENSRTVEMSSIDKIDDSLITSPLLYEFLGDLHQSAGNTAKSRKYWKQAINYGAHADKIKNKLGTLN